MNTSAIFTRVIVTVMLIATIAVTGCTQAIKNPAEMTPKERALLAMKLYNNAFDNYNAQLSATVQPMPQGMVEYFNSYRKLMSTIYPVITAYKTITEAGSVPTIEQEQEIIKIIYQLQAMLTREVVK